MALEIISLVFVATVGNSGLEIASHSLRIMFTSYVLLLALLALFKPDEQPQKTITIHLSCLTFLAILALFMISTNRTSLQTSSIKIPSTLPFVDATRYAVLVLYGILCALVGTTPLSPALRDSAGRGVGGTIGEHFFLFFFFFLEFADSERNIRRIRLGCPHDDIRDSGYRPCEVDPFAILR
jgi:hypothetical protein